MLAISLSSPYRVNSSVPAVLTAGQMLRQIGRADTILNGEWIGQCCHNETHIADTSVGQNGGLLFAVVRRLDTLLAALWMWETDCLQFQWEDGWRFVSTGNWRCVVRWVFHDVSKNVSVSMFEGKANYCASSPPLSLSHTHSVPQTLQHKTVQHYTEAQQYNILWVQLCGYCKYSRQINNTMLLQVVVRSFFIAG